MDRKLRYVKLKENGKKEESNPSIARAKDSLAIVKNGALFR